MKTNIYQDETYLKNNPNWHEEDSAWKVEKILKILDKNNINPNTVCEIGCGAGEILKLLQDNMADNIDFQGFEISPQAFKIAKKKTNEHLKFELADITKKDNINFDLILLIDVIEHIEQYQSFLKKIKPLSKYKVLHIPLDLSVQSMLRKNYLQKLRNDVGHIHFFTKKTALQTLEKLDYKIIDHFYTAWSTELPTKSLLGKIFKIPRKIIFSINQELTVKLFGGYSLIVLVK